MSNTLRARIVGFSTFIIVALYFYMQIDFRLPFKSFSSIYIIFVIFTIVFGIVSQILYDRGNKNKIIGIVSESMISIALNTILLIPLIVINKIIFNIVFRIFPIEHINYTIAYFIVIFFLLLNRYGAEYFNVLIFKLWDNMPDFLRSANNIINRKTMQIAIYFIIVVILVTSQIDKGLYNVYHKEFSDIFIPSTVTFIALERALKSVKVE